jgi:tetratricopeptide (TPR) repeat protein
MNISLKLISVAKIGTHLQITLNNGLSLEGQIIEFDSDGIVIQSFHKLSAASLSSIIAWQLDLSIPEKDCLVDHSSIIATNQALPDDVSEKTLFFNTSPYLEGFNPEKTEYHPMNIKKHISKTPQVLLLPENDSDKKKWDSIMSRYQNALKIEDLSLIEALGEEFIGLASRYKDTGIFYYNAAYFKLKAYNYPHAGELFIRAFKIDKEPDYAYNAACAYLQGGDQREALPCIGAYFCLTGCILDENMWLRFCHIAHDLQQYTTYSTVFRELVGQSHTSQAENKELLMLLRSALYALPDLTEIRELIIDFYEYVDKGNLDTFEEVLEQFLDKFDQLTGESDIFTNDGNPDYIFSLLNETDAKYTTENLSGPQQTNSVPDDDDSLLLLTPATNQISPLKQGTIYRTIPPNKFGFLWDEKALSCHFRYDVIFGGMGYLDSVTIDNPYPVFYLSKPSDIENASTKETATFICSHDFLDNMIELAKNFSKERDYPNALLELKNVLAYDPKNEKALGLKTRWTKIYDEKYKEQAEGFNLQPETPAEWEAKGNMLLELGMYNDAANAFSYSSPGTNSTSGSLYGKGISCTIKLKYEEAIDYFDKALKKNPLHYYAIHAKGEVYNRKRDYNKSIECFEKVISMRPDYIDAWKGMAFALFRLGKYEESIKAYDMILIFEPDNWLELSKKSSVLIKQKDLPKAMRCIDAALEHVPGEAKYLFIKGYIYQIQEKYPEALRYFEMSLDKEPKNTKTLTKKAYVLAILARTGEALEVIEKALHLNMHNPKTWYYKGIVHHYAQDYENAIEAYDRSLELSSGVARVVICRKRALEKLNPIKQFTPDDDKDPQFVPVEKIEDLIANFNQKFLVS